MKSVNNERLRALVQGAQLSQTQALLVFNERLGPAGYSVSSWKAFFVRPASKRFRPLKKELLAHAESVFGARQVKAESSGMDV